MEIRAPVDAEAAAARGLVAAVVAGTPYGELPLERLRVALEASTDESRALIAAAGGEVVGLVLFGFVAGAVRTGVLHLVAVTAAARLRGVATQLIEAAVGELARRGARLVVGEMPDDPALLPARTLLQRAGFAEEARVADYYRDSVDLIVLRRDLGRR